jgi:choline-sulfatase
LFIFSDQQHWQALGFMDRFFNTPHLDNFAKDSIVFENGFCSTPQCSPSRSSILTGFYPSKTRVWGNIGAAGGNPLQQNTIASILDQDGYFTGYAGKWHLGNDIQPRNGWSGGLHLEGGGNAAKTDPITTGNGLKLLNKAATQNKPFALFLSYVDPHDIYYFNNFSLPKNSKNIPLPHSWFKESFEGKPSVQKQFMLEDQGKQIWGKEQNFWEIYRDFHRQKVKRYDNHFGKIIQELKTLGLWNNTIIIHTSDHGDMDTHHKLIFKGPFMYEQMVRIPMMIRVPPEYGGMPAKKNSNIYVVNTDFVPTLLDLCQIPPIKTDGMSLKPILTGKGKQQNRDFVIGQYYSKQKWVNPIRMIRTAEYKFIRYIRFGDELYHLKNDPNELINLVNDRGYLKIKKELSNKLDSWIEKNKDPFYSLKPTDRMGRILS